MRIDFVTSFQRNINALTFVLESMGLIDDEITPCEFVEHIAVEIANFVSSNAYVPLAKLIPLPGLQYVCGNVEALILVSMELNRF